jgi:hypothetical protein
LEGQDPPPPDLLFERLPAEDVAREEQDVTSIIRRRFDDRAHKALDMGWQTLTLCGKRGNWLNGQPGEPQAEEGVVDCPECLAIMEET